MLPVNKTSLFERLNTSQSKQIILLLGCICLCFALYFEPLFLGKSLFWRDINQLYKPLFGFVRETLWQGEMPLWNPYLFGGTPLLAGAEPAVLYPGNLLFWLLDFKWAYPLSLILHHLLAAYGMYRLGRSLSWSYSVAVLAAISFAFSGVMVSMNNFYPLLATSIWIPYIFECAYHLLNQPRRRAFNTALLALFLGLQILSGHFEIVAMTGLFLLMNLLPLLLQNIKTQPERLQVLLWGTFGLSLSIGLAMAQLWPSYELLQLSNRVTEGFAQNHQVWSLNPFSFLALVIPNFHGNLVSDNHLGIFLSEVNFGRSFFFLSHYLGLSGFVCALVAVFTAWKSKERLQTMGWILSFLLCLGLAMGSYSIFYAGLLKALPIFSVFRYPVKFLIPAGFFFSLLCGTGLNQWLKSPKELSFVPYLLGLWASALAAFALILQFRLPDFVKFIWPSLENLYGSPLTPAYAPLIQNMFADLKMRLFIAAAVAVVLLFICLFFMHKQQFLKYAGLAFIIFLSLELFSTGKNTIWTMNRTQLEASSPILNSIKQDLGAQKTNLRIAQNTTASMILPSDLQKTYQHTPHVMMQLANQRQVRNNHAMQAGFLHVGGYAPARTRITDQVLNLFETPGITAHNKSLLESIMSVKYILNGSDANSSLSQRLHSTPLYQILEQEPPLKGIEVWKRKHTLPRAYFRHLALVNKDKQQILEALTHAQEIGFDPEKHVLIEDNTAHQKSLLLVPASPAQTENEIKPEFKSISHHHQHIQLTTNRSGYLVISDQYYPGWRAFDHAKETPILNANYFQKALRLGPGEHQIDLIFQPRSFLWGRWISLGCLFCILFMLWFYRKSEDENMSSLSHIIN